MSDHKYIYETNAEKKMFLLEAIQYICIRQPRKSQRNELLFANYHTKKLLKVHVKCYTNFYSDSV